MLVLAEKRVQELRVRVLLMIRLTQRAKIEKHRKDNDTAE